MEEDSSLTQDRLAFRMNFGTMANFIEVSGISTPIEEDSGRSVSALASSSTLELTGMLLYSWTQTSKTLRRPQRRSSQRRHSLTILELFTTLNRDLMAARLSEKLKGVRKICLNVNPGGYPGFCFLGAHTKGSDFAQ